jgi:uncharacterized membrane protein YidH (DUF202 family)
MAQSQEVVAECPTCQASVPLEATECPRCGELFEGFSGNENPVAAGGSALEQPRAEATQGGRAGFREKLLFYMGIFLILLGGPGIALGSWLHDELRIGIGEYTAYDVFGPWNRLVAAVGLIVLIVGIVFLILSLRLSRPSEVEKELDTLRES